MNPSSPRDVIGGENFSQTTTQWKGNHFYEAGNIEPPSQNSTLNRKTYHTQVQVTLEVEVTNTSFSMSLINLLKSSESDAKENKSYCCLQSLVWL